MGTRVENYDQDYNVASDSNCSAVSATMYLFVTYAATFKMILQANQYSACTLEGTLQGFVWWTWTESGNFTT